MSKIVEDYSVRPLKIRLNRLQTMTNQTVYFISGGNRGVGLRLVKQLSERESTVVITSARKPEAATELNQLIKNNPNVHVVKLDVTSKESCLKAAQEVANLVEGIDVLISNAAIADTEGTVLGTEEENWIKHYRTNVLGSIFLFQAFYPLIAKGDRKQIVFVSSRVGSIGDYIESSTSAYGQSKAALNYTTKEISFELRDKGFTVIAVHPGLVSTDMGKRGKDKMIKSNPQLKDELENIFLTPETSASSLIGVFDNLDSTHNGRFINYDGVELAW